MKSWTARGIVDLALAGNQAWRLVRKSAAQEFLSGGLFRFAGTMPPVRDEGYEATHRVMLFGRVPAWRHWQRFERVDDSEMTMLLRERGGPYRTWNHHMVVESSAGEGCRYRESIEVEAGVVTPLVWLAAHLLCRMRARRLSALAQVLL